MLRNYLWVAARNLLKYRVFALINVIGLAVGVACCLILALYIHHEWVYDRHHPDAEKIYRIIRESTDEAGTQSFTNHTPGALNQALRGEVQGVQTSVRLMTRAGWMKTSERGFQERLCLADPEILDVFALPLIRGDRRTGLKSHGSIFVTESVARKYFGMADPLGLIVRADDFMFGGEYTITGVLKDLPETTLIQFDFLTSTAPGREVNGWQENDYLRNAWERWGGWPNENYAVLSSEAQPAQIEEQLTSFALRNSYAASQHHTRYHLQPITRAHLYPRQDYGFSPQGFLYRTNGDIRRLQVAVALGMFIFVLAGVNFVNLSTARFMLRAREVGMRKVVGARRSQIAGQFLGESILQSGLSHLLALAIAGLSLPHLSSWMGVTVTIEHPGWLWILILPTSVLITGVLAGMCPAFIISNFNPVAAVKADRVTGAGGVSLRRVLVVFQFSLSVLLIAGTWVVISQWRFMVAKDPGYNRENVVTLPYPVGDPEAVRQQFLANPKIMHASVTNNAPIRASYFSLRPEGWAEDWNVHFFDLDVDLLNVFGFELLEGSDYSDSRDGRGFILNEAAVKALGWEAPIGKTIMWEIYPMTVIGVVKDFHFESLRERIKPLVLGRIGNRIHLVLRVDSGDLAETMAFIGKTWKGLRPDRPYSYRFLVTCPHLCVHIQS